jgi:hypothetical protein
MSISLGITSKSLFECAKGCNGVEGRDKDEEACAFDRAIEGKQKVALHSGTDATFFFTAPCAIYGMFWSPAYLFAFLPVYYVVNGCYIFTL